MIKRISLITLLVLLLGGPAFAQTYKSRQPTADEERKISGVNWYLQDGPRENLFIKHVGEGENFTAQLTNSTFVFRSDAALTNCVLILPNPTNSNRRQFSVVNLGNVTTKLTNAVVGTITSPTNATASTYTLNTNISARIICTGTNWLVVPDRL